MWIFLILEFRKHQLKFFALSWFLTQFILYCQLIEQLQEYPSKTSYEANFRPSSPCNGQSKDNIIKQFINRLLSFLFMKTPVKYSLGNAEIDFAKSYTKPSSVMYSTHIGTFSPSFNAFNKTLSTYETPIYKNKLHYEKDKASTLKVQPFLQQQAMSQFCSPRLSVPNATIALGGKQSQDNVRYSFQKQSPATTSTKINRGLFHSLSYNGGGYSNDCKQSKKIQSNQKQCKPRRSQSLGKKGKFLTVVSRMPINKKEFPQYQ